MKSRSTSQMVFRSQAGGASVLALQAEMKLKSSAAKWATDLIDFYLGMYAKYHSGAFLLGVK